MALSPSLQQGQPIPIHICEDGSHHPSLLSLQLAQEQPDRPKLQNHTKTNQNNKKKGNNKKKKQQNNNNTKENKQTNKPRQASKTAASNPFLLSMRGWEKQGRVNNVQAVQEQCHHCFRVLLHIN